MDREKAREGERERERGQEREKEGVFYNVILVTWSLKI